VTGCPLGEVTVDFDADLVRMREMAAETTGLAPVTIKPLPAFGTLLVNGAALHAAALDKPWAQGARARIRPGPCARTTTGAGR